MSLDVSREICALGRGNMHVSRHKSSSMCSTREKINSCSSEIYFDSSEILGLTFNHP